MARAIVTGMLIALLFACGDDASGAAEAGAAGGGPGAHDAATLDAGGDDAGASADGVWEPQAGITWQWQLTGALDTSLDVAMYDIDLFDTPAATLAALHAQGRVVICYFSAGTREDWRDDAADFVAADHGRGLPDW